MNPLTLSGDVTLGNILTIVTLIGIAIAFGKKVGSFESTLKLHSDSLDLAADRIAAHDLQISAVVQALAQFGVFEATLKSYASGLESVADRLNKHEERILDVVTSLQRLVGQSEVMFRRNDERYKS